jgi:hypothetical protein
MAGLSELNSFVGIFLNLWQSGCDASLNLKTRDGKATINLQLGLGQAPPPPSSQPPPRHVPGPSRQRRTQRRALAREQAVQAKSKYNVEEVAENTNAEVDNDKSESAEIATDEVVQDKSDKSAEQAKKDLPCLICDFVSSWETSLQIHMTKKHSTVEQVDGNATLNDDNLVEDDKYSDTCHYWKTGILGTSFQVFLDATEIINSSNLSEVFKELEKDKVLEARKCAFGENYKYVPPWNYKR